jgi:hypothetical protein
MKAKELNSIRSSVARTHTKEYQGRGTNFADRDQKYEDRLLGPLRRLLAGFRGTAQKPRRYT